MVTGLIVFSWDDRIGAELKAKFPENFEISEKTLKQIYSSHFLEDRGGFLSLLVGTLNVASYYTGLELNYFISLLLDFDEDADDYEEALIDAARIITINLENDKYLSLLPSIYNRILLYPTIEDEQKLAFVYTDEAKHLIINRLAEEGNATKNDLLSWLKEKMDVDYLDIDGILNSLVKLGLIKVSLVKNFPSEMVFLTADLVLIRKPPVHVIKLIKSKNISESITSEYLSNVKSFFQNYVPTLDDEKIISDIIADAETKSSPIIVSNF